MDPNSLTSPDEAIEHALATLGRAAKDKKAAMRWPVLCTSGPSGRVVVLRQFDRNTRTCRIYTDQRTTKMRDFANVRRAELVFFDPGKMLQIRLSGPVNIVTSGADWDAALHALPEAAKQDYAALLPPGAKLEGPEAALDPNLIAGNFVMIDIVGEAIDWLLLSRDGHRRARGYWPAQGEHRTDWLVP